MITKIIYRKLDKTRVNYKYVLLLDILYKDISIDGNEFNINFLFDRKKIYIALVDFFGACTLYFKN